MMRLSLFFLLSFGLLLPGWSQQVAKSDYSTQSFVSEESETSIEFQNDGNFVRHDREKILIQAEAGRQYWGLLRFPYASEHDELKIDFLRVIKPNGTVVTNDISEAQDLPSAITQQAPMYSDTREKHLPVKGLNIGDRIEFAYTTRSKTPMIPGQFWFSYAFSDEVITLNQTLRVSVPAGRNVKLRSAVAQPRIEKKGDRVVYAWRHENTRVPDKDDGPDPDEILDRAQPADIQISSFATWEEIGRWYWQLQGDRMRPTPEIAAKAKEITQGKTTSEAKARALAHFVATQVRYIATEFGIGRYQPHSAAEVLANGYGDCKDKHTLYAAMLESIGLQGYPVLIGTESVIDRSAPIVSDFNHVFTVVRLPGKDIWADTTGEIYPFGFLPIPLRDKDVLVASAEPQLLRTPAEPNRPSIEKFSIIATLGADGVLQGDVKREVMGDLEVPLRMAFRAVPEANWKDVVQKLSQLSGFGGTVDKVTVTPPEDTDTVLTIAYDYKRKDYAGFSTGYTNPPLPPSGVSFARLEKRKTDFVLFPVGRFEYSAQMRLPVGSRMEAPDDVDLVDDFAEYHAKYRVEGNVFFADRVTVIKKQRIAPAQFAAYEKFAKAVGDDVTKQSYLSLGSAVAKETPKLVSRPPSAESARLINEARDAYMRRDFRTALSFVQKVIDQDPDYPNAWMVKAGVHMALGENEAAVAALNKDIELHPKAAEGSYRMLDDYYRRTERMPQALELAKKFAENHPDNLDAKVSLGRMYFMQQQYAKAAEVFEKAVALAPSDVTIQFQLALAKLELGQADVAFSSLQDIVKKDPNRLNDAAYMLLDKKVHMDVALAWAEEAVKDVEIQASKIDLQQLSIDDNRTMISLAAYWDTLGWGYFQMGKYADAEKYLRAAYTIMPSTAIAEHYAESLEKNNKRQAAIDVYAVAALASGDLGKKAKQRLQILGPPRMDLVTREARGRSSNSRTFKIPGLKPGKNVISSDVLLLIGHDGKIEDLKFLGSEEGFDEKSMRAMDLGMVFPNDRPAKVFRRGIAMCTPVSGCNLTLLTPDTVRSVN